MDRLEQLKRFAQEEPDDPFNLYALALEYLKTEPSTADDLFEELLREHPEYLPTYYPYAQRLAEQKDTIRAEQVFLLGIDTARKYNQAKTLREIQAAYNDWMNE